MTAENRQFIHERLELLIGKTSHLQRQLLAALESNKINLPKSPLVTNLHDYCSLAAAEASSLHIEISALVKWIEITTDDG